MAKKITKIIYVALSLSFFVAINAYGEGQQNLQANVVEGIKKQIEKDKTNPKLYFDLSKEYGSLKMGNEALDAINEAVKLDPKNISYLLHRGIVANWVKKPIIMEESYRRAHELDPGNQEAILGLARADVQLGKLDEAVKFFETYLEKTPNDKEVILEYINVQIWTKNLEKAKQLLENYKSRFGDSEKYQQSIKLLENATPKIPAPSSTAGTNVTSTIPAPANTTGASSSMAGVNNLKAQIEKDKNNPKLYFDLSKEYGALKMGNEAFNAINEAIKLDPKNVSYLLHRAAIANWLKNQRVMEESYKRAHELDPGNQEAILGLARVNVQLKKLKEAAQLYQIYLEKKPDDKDVILEYINVQIWMKNLDKAKVLLANYKSRFGDSPKYQESLKQLQVATPAPKAKDHGKVAAKIGPKDAKYYVGLSQNYASKNQPKEALRAIDQALQFEPNNINYLKTRGQLASWAGNLSVMEDSYAKILALDFNNSNAILGLARACSWQGKIKCAIANYKRYLCMNPQSEEALIEYSDVKTQIEAYREARNLLYIDRFYHGETKPYRAQLAKLYAIARWYDSANYYNDPLLSAEPNNFNYLLTDAYAKYASRKYGASLEVLSHLRQVQPKAAEINFLDLYLPKPIRSYITIDELGLGDTHTVRLSETSMHGYVFLNSTTAFHFTSLYEYAKATDIQYTPVFGGQHIDDISGKVGIFHRFAPYLDVEGNIGALSIQNVNNYTIGDVKATWFMNERMWLNYGFYHDLFRPNLYVVFSPRSISLGIMQSDNRWHLHLEPALQRNLDFYVEYNKISDSNVLRHYNIWPNLRLLSVPGWTINAGVDADLYSFTRTDLNNGYYSPRLAQTYVFTASAYHGFNLNSGITFSGAIGMNKDETFHEFMPAADFSVDAIFGIYRNWQLEMIGGYSYRGNPTQAYQVVSGKVALTRRF